MSDQAIGGLVVTRKVGEKIHIGDDIVIELHRVAGNRASIYVQAPKSVRILRGELKERQDLPQEGEAT